MPSKLVADRQKSATAVAAAADTYGERIGQALTSLFTPYLRPDEQLPDFTLVVELIGRAQRGSADVMMSADETHELELSDDDAPRQARDQARDALAAEIISLRDLTRALYGPGIVRALGLEGDTPDDPVQLMRLGRQVVEALGKIPLPPPRLAGATIDVAQITSRLAGLARDLERHLDEVAREVREAQVTQTQKNRSISDYDAFFAGAAMVVAGFLRLAGERELADRVRPSRRRPGQTAGDAENDQGGATPPTQAAVTSTDAPGAAAPALAAAQAPQTGSSPAQAAQ
jgi:hypothetical protein